MSSIQWVISWCSWASEWFLAANTAVGRKTTGIHKEPGNAALVWAGEAVHLCGVSPECTRPWLLFHDNNRVSGSYILFKSPALLPTLTKLHKTRGWSSRTARAAEWERSWKKLKGKAVDAILGAFKGTQYHRPAESFYSSSSIYRNAKHCTLLPLSSPCRQGGFQLWAACLCLCSGGVDHHAQPFWPLFKPFSLPPLIKGLA